MLQDLQRILILIFALTSSLSMAQTQIDNAGFENWIDQVNEDDSLVDWSSTSNLLFQPYVVISKNPNAIQGDYAVDIHTNPIGFTGASTVGILVNGDATFSAQNQMYYEQGGGTPISFQPTHLKGYYKFTTTNPSGDEALARVVLSKWNEVFNQRDTVSYATMNFPEVDDYTEFVIPLPDLMSEEDPDSITTILYSSNPATVEQFGVQSTFTLDSLNLTTEPVGLTEDPLALLQVFPNPTSGMVYLQSAASVGQIQIFNSLGIRVSSISAISSNMSQHLDLSDLPSGIYYLVPNNEVRSATKLVLQ